MAAKRQDGNAVVVVANGTFSKDKPVFLQGFHGFLMDNCENTDEVAIDISGAVWEVTAPAGVGVARGDKVYITDDGTHGLTATATGNVLLGITVEPRDANGIAWVKQTSQVGATA